MLTMWRAIDATGSRFIAPDGTLVAVTVAASGSTFEAGRPVALLPTSPDAVGFPKAQYAVSRDGRFLMNQTIEESTAVPITLIQNWQPEVKK